eukprot:674148-Pyramimonas_sp.AAC.1
MNCPTLCGTYQRKRRLRNESELRSYMGRFRASMRAEHVCARRRVALTQKTLCSALCAWMV